METTQTPRLWKDNEVYQTKKNVLKIFINLPDPQILLTQQSGGMSKIYQYKIKIKKYSFINHTSTMMRK